MGTPVSFRIEDGCLTADLGEFCRQFASALAPLVAYLSSLEFRAHPRWRGLVPFDVACYGQTRSVGHCVRPDIIPTRDGPRVCELDFVPSGRGFVLDGLRAPADRHAFLVAFADWYEAMCVRGVAYATATRTVCFPETVRFATLLREVTGVPIDAINIDRDPVQAGTLVDRLFYRSELASPTVAEHQIITAEPWLDSKMILAVIHDPAMTGELTDAVGAEHLAFLREVVLPTFPLAVLREQDPAFLATKVLGLAGGGPHATANRRGWVVKNSDVETDASWGSRGVVVGSQYTETVFAGAVLNNVPPPRKDLGRNPVLQRFAHSDDLREIWDALVAGRIVSPDAPSLGMDLAPIAQRPAQRPVCCRLGFYFLLANPTGQVFTPRAGVCTLRQDVLAHGASDARILAVTTT